VVGRTDVLVQAPGRGIVVLVIDLRRLAPAAVPVALTISMAMNKQRAGPSHRSPLRRVHKWVGDVHAVPAGGVAKHVIGACQDRCAEVDGRGEMDGVVASQALVSPSAASPGSPAPTAQPGSAHGRPRPTPARHSSQHGAGRPAPSKPADSVAAPASAAIGSTSLAAIVAPIATPELEHRDGERQDVAEREPGGAVSSRRACRSGPRVKIRPMRTDVPSVEDVGRRAGVPSRSGCAGRQAGVAEGSCSLAAAG
jgi:hypothetical protein